ncbi:MAG: hypothetical protein FH749_06725 [Firmicutes bacterium]|nr:hypothetical protein [Bacillota bacterium]
MKKHKLFLPALLALMILAFGTSLAIGAINGNGSEAMDESGDDGENITAFDANQELDLQMTEENPTDDEEPDSIDESTEDAEKDNDENVITTEAAKEDKAVETKPKDEPKPEPAPKPQPDKATQMARITVDGLNVRPDPSTNNERIDVLLRGETVEVLAEQNNWLQVKLSDGRTGWVSGAYAHKYSASSGNGALNGRVIALDPGHGGRDPGAVGVTGLQEKEINLDVSLRVADQLRAEGATVIMTRENDVFIPLTQRVSIAQAAGAEVFVSVHANAHPSPQIGGTETYYFRNGANSNASFKLANLMQSELVGALKLRDIGVKDGSFHVIRQTSMPSALLELAFLSNAHEESLMRTDEFRQNAADAIVRAFKHYFN